MWRLPSPNGLNLLTMPNSRVLGNQSNAGGQGCGPDESIARIPGIIVGKMVGQNSHLWRDWLNSGARRNLFHERFRGARNLQSPMNDQPCQ